MLSFLCLVIVRVLKTLCAREIQDAGLGRKRVWSFHNMTFTRGLSFEGFGIFCTLICTICFLVFRVFERVVASVSAMAMNKYRNVKSAARNCDNIYLAPSRNHTESCSSKQLLLRVENCTRKINFKKKTLLKFTWLLRREKNVYINFLEYSMLDDIQLGIRTKNWPQMYGPSSRV